MDSLNLPSMQNTQINCKSTGSNTVPTSCTFCGSKNYADPCYQFPCFQAVYSSAPSDNQSSKNKKENFIFQQPLLSSPSFFNDLLPPNLFFTSTFGTNSNYTSVLDQGNNKIQKHTSSSDEDLFHQANKSECCSNDLTTTTESNCISEPLDNSQSQRSTENSQKSFVQRCGCNNTFPWICRPFLIPVVSYCVLWNSRTSNPNFSGSNYFCTHQKSEAGGKKTKDTKLGVQTGERKVFTDSNVNQAQEEKKENQNEFWRGDKLKKNEWKISTHKDGSNSSFLSLNSINYTEEGGYCEVEKKLEVESLVKNSSQDSNLDNIKIPSQEMISDENHKAKVILEEKNTEDEKTSSEESDNEETLGLGQQNLTDSNDLWFTNASLKNTSTHIVEELVSLEPSPKVEVIKNYERLNESPINENLNQSTGENWTKEDREKILDIVEFSPPDRSSVKKSIKNFTMTEEVINTMNGEEAISMSAAAAGDLGGAQCAGYRVNLSFSKIDPQETQTEESLKLQGFSENSLMESQDSKIQTKSNTNSSLKNFPKPKSGIAKLSGKISTELSKNHRPEDKLQQKETLVTKKKHNCLVNENKAEISGNIVKPQKAKLFNKFQEQAHESDKQFLKKNTNKNLTTKKEEKDKLSTVRPQNSPKIFKY